ncbi:MAG: 5-oxoprolinase subunit PxpB [Pseudomonadota bacterium]
MDGGESTDTTPRFLPFGDAALIVEFGTEKDRALSAAVLALDARIADDPPAGVVETAPSFRSLLVQFDPLATDGPAVEAAIRRLLADPTTAGAGTARLWHLPACYEGERAPDLDAVAERAGLSPAGVIDLHAGRDHHVYMIGFLPGCPYMGDLPSAIDFPRRSDPRTAVPAGSVAIAVGLTVIYPVASPGGWHLIGRTPVRLFDPAAARPALLAPGDAVRFEPMAPSAYAEIEAAAQAGEWQPESAPRAGEPERAPRAGEPA